MHACGYVGSGYGLACRTCLHSGEGASLLACYVAILGAGYHCRSWELFSLAFLFEGVMPGTILFKKLFRAGTY